MSFEAPILLVVVAVVPLAALGYWWLQRRSSAYAVHFSNVSVLASVAGTRSGWRRHVPAAFLLAALALLLVGFARPTVMRSVPSERAAVVLVVDVSGSMRAKDVQPSRLVAAKQAMQKFIEQVPKELRVGLVSFSDDAQVLVPPTADRALLAQGIQLLGPGFGTALGDAIARSVDLARSSTSEVGADAQAPARDSEGRALASVLLLSDGAQTRGVLSPGQGAERAIEAGIPIYTVALGTDAGTIEVGPPGQRQVVPVPPDRETLTAVADVTGGESFDAESSDALEDVYDGLGSRIGRTSVPREVTSAFVAAGALLLAAAATTAVLAAPRLP